MQLLLDEIMINIIKYFVPIDIYTILISKKLYQMQINFIINNINQLIKNDDSLSRTILHVPFIEK